MLQPTKVGLLLLLTTIRKDAVRIASNSLLLLFLSVKIKNTGSKVSQELIPIAMEDFK